jgi:hypothetical protein
MAKVALGTKMSAQMRREAVDRVSVAKARLKVAKAELKVAQKASDKVAYASINQLSEQHFPAPVTDERLAVAIATLKEANAEFDDAQLEAQNRGKPDGPFKKMYQRFKNFFNGDGFNDNETLGQREVDKLSEIKAPFNDNELRRLAVEDRDEQDNQNRRADVMRTADNARGANFTPADVLSYEQLKRLGYSTNDAVQINAALQAEADRLNGIRAAAEPGIQSEFDRAIAPVNAIDEGIQSERDRIYRDRDVRNPQLQAEELAVLQAEGYDAIREEQSDASALGDPDFIDDTETPIDDQGEFVTIAQSFVGTESQDGNTYGTEDSGELVY